MHETTGVRHVRLDKNTIIPAHTVLSTGMEVLRANDGRGREPYMFGNIDEDLGVIQELISEGGSMYARVNWPQEYTTVDKIDFLLAYTDFLTWSEKSGHQQRTPKYHVDQVLFIKPTKADSFDYGTVPSIGSPYETDMKVTDVLFSRFGSVIKYQVYIPNRGYATYDEHMFVTAAERERILHNDYKEYFFSEDRLPFFRRGERVKMYDGHLYNINETVIVKLNDELRACLSWAIKPE